jgi:hypothetical protein
MSTGCPFDQSVRRALDAAIAGLFAPKAGAYPDRRSNFCEHGRSLNVGRKLTIAYT